MKKSTTKFRSCRRTCLCGKPLIGVNFKWTATYKDITDVVFCTNVPFWCDIRTPKFFNQVIYGSSGSCVAGFLALEILRVRATGRLRLSW